MLSGNLEYLMSSLPHLSFQNTEETRLRISSVLKKYAGSSEKELSLIEILDKEAVKFLTPKAYRILRQIDLNTIHDTSFQQSKNRILAAFSKYVFSLKKTIRQLRIARRNNKNEPSQQQQILPLIPGTPLEEEIQLMRWQWEKLEELSIGHYTDFGALITYRLKLMILIRWWNLDVDQGFETFFQLSKQNEPWPTRS